MFCSNCACDFLGWSGRCPTCGALLMDEPPPAQVFDNLPYPGLLDQIQNRGGFLNIPARTTAVQRTSERGVPYFGFGFSWAVKIEGEVDGIHLVLETFEKRSHRARRFPWRGYGFAWPVTMSGTLAGNELKVNTIQVVKERRWRFPYFGFGYAWPGEMRGTCGNSLSVRLMSPVSARTRATRFPFRGHGYAWLRHCTIGITVITPDSTHLPNEAMAAVSSS